MDHEYGLQQHQNNQQHRRIHGTSPWTAMGEGTGSLTASCGRGQSHNNQSAAPARLAQEAASHVFVQADEAPRGHDDDHGLVSSPLHPQ